MGSHPGFSAGEVQDNGGPPGVWDPLELGSPGVWGPHQGYWLLWYIRMGHRRAPWSLESPGVWVPWGLGSSGVWVPLGFGIPVVRGPHQGCWLMWCRTMEGLLHGVWVPLGFGVLWSLGSPGVWGPLEFGFPWGLGSSGVGAPWDHQGSLLMRCRTDAGWNWTWC